MRDFPDGRDGGNRYLAAGLGTGKLPGSRCGPAGTMIAGLPFSVQIRSPLSESLQVTRLSQL
jgi:hypothetical protein